jgi:hypothetical protein
MLKQWVFIGWVALAGVLFANITYCQDISSPVATAEENENSGYVTISGTIDRLGEGEMVVDDSLYLLTSSLAVYSANGNAIPFGELHEGIEVGLQLNQEGEIVSLWKLKK